MLQDLSLILDFAAATVTIAYLGRLVFEALMLGDSACTKKSLLNQNVSQRA